MQARLLPGFLFYDRIRVALTRALHLGHRARSFLIVSQQRAWATVGLSRSAEFVLRPGHPAAPRLECRRVIPQRRVWSAVGSSRSAEPEPPLGHPAAPSPSRPVQIILQRRICIAPGPSRNAELLPSLDYPAAPIPGRPVPDTALRSLRGE